VAPGNEKTFLASDNCRLGVEMLTFFFFKTFQNELRLRFFALAIGKNSQLLPPYNQLLSKNSQ